MKTSLSAALFLLFSSLAFAQKNKTPLDTSKIFCFQGHTTTQSAYLWCSMPEDLVQAGGFFYYQFPNWEETGEVYEAEVNWKFFDGIAYGRLFIEGLQPGTKYPLYFRSPKTKKKYIREVFTYPSEQDSLTLLLGSCAMKGFGITKLIKPGNSYPIYKTMSGEKADAMLWMGDNLYFMGEATQDEKQIRKHLLTKSVPDLQKFLASTPQYAMWDDHDFGPNNSDGTFEYKHLSFKNFNDFWANPAPVDSSKGLYYQISYPLADIFMLDNRFSSRTGVNYLGNEQMNWLREGLKKSTKPFKIIVSGIQAGNKFSLHENLFVTGEWDTIVGIIRENQIPGVLFLNGDRHHSEVFQHNEPGLYPLYEYTCSPLTSYPSSVKKKSLEFDIADRIKGITSEYLYGKLVIKALPDSPGTYECQLEALDINGKRLWDITIVSSELDFRK